MKRMIVIALMVVMATVGFAALAQEVEVSTDVELSYFAGIEYLDPGAGWSLSGFAGVTAPLQSGSLSLIYAVDNFRDPLLFHLDALYKDSFDLGIQLDFKARLATEFDIRAANEETIGFDSLTLSCGSDMTDNFSFKVSTEIDFAGNWISVPWIEIGAYWGQAP